MMLRSILIGLVVGLPLLVLTTCTYRHHSPHLLLDPITRASLTAVEHPSGWWRTIDVALLPNLLAPGLNLMQVNARLEKAGFTLLNDDIMPQSYRQSQLEDGYTHTFTRNGRGRIACGETLFVRIGMQEGALVKAVTHASWTCL